MSAVATPGPMTVEEWASLDDERYRGAELVNGYLEEGEVTDMVHEVVVSWLVEKLRAYFRPRGGYVATSNAGFALGPRHGRSPDLTVFATRPPPARGVVRFPADIAVEIVSPGAANHRRDRIIKVVEYARFGFQQYWIVDPEMRAIEILVLRDGLYVHAASATDGELAAPAYDALVLDLDELWAEVESLPEE